MLARAFLRLCALEALRPSSLLAGDTGWPTLAGKFVSDSRIDPIDDVTSDERRPLIAVYTEKTHLEKIAQSGPVFHKGFVDLTFEISVVGKFATEGGEPIIDFCETDAQTEAALDALEDQIYWCLHFGPSGELFRKIAKLPADDWESTPHRSGEEAIKLARRTLAVRFRMRETCYEAAPSAAPADLARLPPALQSIAESLSASTFLAEIVLGMARAAPVMPTRVDFDRLGATLAPNPNNPDTPTVGVVIDNLQGS